MGKKSIAKNYAYNVMYQILVMIIPLITTPYVSRVLGAESIGIYSYTLSIATYFALFGTLGISMYAQREIAYVQEDKRKKSIIFWEINIIRFITMCISMTIFYFSFVSGQNEYNLYYRILLIDLVANCFEITWFFNGMEEFKKTVIRNGIIKWISTILVFVLVKKSDDLIKYILIYSISTLLGQLSMWLYLPKYLQKIEIRELKLLRHIRPIMLLFIPQIATQIYNVLDKTMIGMIVESKSEVGFYEQAQKIIKLLISVVTSLGTVMVPRMANTFAKKDYEKMKEYLKKSFNFVCFLAFPMFFGIISVANKFVPVFFGDGYESVITLMIIISPIILFMGLSNITGMQYLLPSKRQKEYTISVVCGAIVNIIFNVILINKFKAIGASIATVIAELTVFVVQLCYMKSFMKIKDLFSTIKRYAILAFLMGAISYIVGLFINSNIISIILQIVIGASVYIISLIILKDEFLQNILKKLHLNFLIR